MSIIAPVINPIAFLMRRLADLDIPWDDGDLVNRELLMPFGISATAGVVVVVRIDVMLMTRSCHGLGVQAMRTAYASQITSWDHRSPKLRDEASNRVGRRASNVARRSSGRACDHLTATGDVYGQTSDDAVHAAIAGLTGALGP